MYNRSKNIIAAAALMIYSCGTYVSENNNTSQSDSVVLQKSMHEINHATNEQGSHTIVSNQSARPVTPTAEDLGKQIYQAFIANDTSFYISLLPTVDEINALLDAAKLDEKVKAQSKTDFPKKRSAELSKTRTKFAAARQALFTLATDGANDISFVKVHAPFVTLPAGFEQAPEVFIVSRIADKIWAILIKDCIHTPSGWRASGEISFYGEWKEKQ
jgi:hypothetical protein